MMSRSVRAFIAVLLILGWPGFAAQAQVKIGPPPAGIDPFYKKHVDARGIPVVASAEVSDDALAVAHEIVSHMLSKRPDLARALARNNIKVIIIGLSEKWTDLPELSFRKGKPSQDEHDRRCGGGATLRTRTTVICEGNLTGVNDPFRGSQPILIHEFGHTIQSMALDDKTRAAISAAYARARAKNMFRNADGSPSHMMKSDNEYFATGSAMWFTGAFPVNRPKFPPIATRDELKAYDPDLHAILAEIYPDDDWRPPKRPYRRLN
jgi:hypothetical protein